MGNLRKQAKASREVSDRLDVRSARARPLAGALPVFYGSFNQSCFGEMMSQKFGLRLQYLWEFGFKRGGDSRMKLFAAAAQEGRVGRVTDERVLEQCTMP